MELGVRAHGDFLLDFFTPAVAVARTYVRPRLDGHSEEILLETIEYGWLREMDAWKVSIQKSLLFDQKNKDQCQ